MLRTVEARATGPIMPASRRMGPGTGDWLAMSLVVAMAMVSCDPPPDGPDGPLSHGGSDAGPESVGEPGATDGGEVVEPLPDFGASLSAIVDYANSIRDLTVEDRRAAILAFVRARPEFIVSGSNDDGVWALFSNGYPMMFLENREPDGDPNAEVEKPTTEAVRTEVPTGPRARLINAVGTAYVNNAKPLKALLEAKKYVVDEDLPNPGSVESLRKVSGDGVFYLSTHAGVCRVPVYDDRGKMLKEPNGEPMTAEAYCLWTSTKVGNLNSSPYDKDLRSSLLGFGVAGNNFGPDKKTVVFEKHYWITEAWAANYWSFAPDALVWLNTCESASSESSGFRTAILGNGAGLYVGWTSSVKSAQSKPPSRFVIDRLLGSNLSEPKEDPPQRPFDYESVWADLRKRGLHRFPTKHGGTTELVYETGPGGFGLLAPSIAYVLLNETKDEAILKGQFGKPQEKDRLVTIGGAPAAIKEWAEDSVRVDLKRSGPGSSGDVVVTVRGHESNVRRITEWNLGLQYTWGYPNLAPCMVSGPIQLRFREDIGEYREQPGQPPKKPLRYAMATRDSRATLSASGTAGGACRTTYSENGTLVAAGYGDDSLVLANWIRTDTNSKQLDLCLLLGAKTPPWTATTTCGDDSQTGPIAPSFGFSTTNMVEFKVPTEESSVVLPALTLRLDDNWGIIAGSHEEYFGGAKIHLQWGSAPALSPPDPKAAR